MYNYLHTKSKHVPQSLFLLALLFFTFSALADDVLKDPQPIPIPYGLTEQDVEDAIIDGLRARGWVPEKQEPGKIIVSITIRDNHSITDTITYNHKMITINYLDSVNMRYRIEDPATIDEWTTADTPGKVPLIHHRYNDWVNNLAGDITFSLRKIQAAK